MNQRVYEGLSYYISAQRAHAQAAVSRRAAEKLAQFEGLMRARVDGGLSDMSEQQVISQRYAEVQAQLAAGARQRVDDQADAWRHLTAPGPSRWVWPG